MPSRLPGTNTLGWTLMQARAEMAAAAGSTGATCGGGRGMRWWQRRPQRRPATTGRCRGQCPSCSRLRHLGDDALARLEQPRMQFGHAKCLLYAHGPRDLVYKRVPSRRHERKVRMAQGLGLLRRSRRLDLAVHLVIPYDASLSQHDVLFGERDLHMMWPSCGDHRGLRSHKAPARDKEPVSVQAA